jgi:2-iminobutanoate/2-iminopropanoate deaminase
MLTPDTLPKPLGRYSHLSVARGVDLVSVAGQVSVDAHGNYVAVGSVFGQAVKAYENVRDALATVDLAMTDIVKCNAYVVGTDRIADFMRARTEVYARYFPDGVYPPITLVAVAGLAFPELLVEIECLAAMRRTEQ